MIDLSRFMGKTAEDSLPASDWNAFVALLQSGINSASSDAPAETPFAVNGVQTSPVNGVVSLASKGKYVLSGHLDGRVVIGSASDDWPSTERHPTQVILNGCTIVDDSTENAALEYVSPVDKCFITVANNTRNHIVCTHVAPQADSQKGAIHCENNLVVQGSGYLSCINRGGHGIKASELRITGNPHIFVNAEHDGIHGNKILVVENGVFYIDGANDAFGTRAYVPASGTDESKAAGYIVLYGGEFFAYNIRQNVFDSKGAGGCICVNLPVMNTKDVPSVVYAAATGIVLHTDVPETQRYFNMDVYDPKQFPVLVNGMVLDGDTYTANSTEVTIQGYFENKKFVFNDQDVKVVLNNAYIVNDNSDAMFYSPSKKNIKLSPESETKNFIIVHGEGNACIRSNNNIVFEPKNNSAVIMRSDDEYAVVGSEVTFRDANGSVIVKDNGISGSAINFGEDAKEAFAGSLIAKKIYARVSSSGQKGTVNVHSTLHIGCVTVDHIHATATANLGDSYGVSYHSFVGSSVLGDHGRTAEPYDVIPYLASPIPSV